MLKSLLYISFIILFFNNCSKSEDLNVTSSPSTPSIKTGWDVPISQIVFTSNPPDRIQSIDSPHFELINNENLKAYETAYVYLHKGIIKVYPENILAIHEIINDEINGHFFSLSLCPLTGSAMAWNRNIDGVVTEFGVSGHLFNDNLIPYDRNSNSYWSQMQFSGIKGKYSGHILESELLLKTLGKTIHASFPDALVLVESGEHTCDSICYQSKKQWHYNRKTTKSKNSILNNDHFGIIAKNIIHADEALLFSTNDFSNQIQIYQVKYNNLKLVIIGSKSNSFITAFIDNTNIPNNKFYPIQDSLPIIMRDNLGNKYDILGRALEGPNLGSRLSSPPAYFAHQFAWDLFYPNKYIVFQ